MAGVAGLRGTGNWGTDERPKNFRESILWYSPNGTAPIFAMTAKAGKKTVDDPEFAWWSEPNVLVRLRVNGTLAAGDTVVTVDTADPTATTAGANWGTATHLKNGDVLLVDPPTVDLLAFTQELIQVENVMSDTQFTVKRGVGGTTAASIPTTNFLTLVNSAFAEGTGAPKATSRNPIKYSNLTQIFKDTYELTGTADETKARTGSAWSNDKKRKTFDHSRAIEMSILFGRKFETVGDNGKPMRFMGGLRSFIPSTNTFIFTAGVLGIAGGMGVFLDKVSPLFDFDTGAGDTRIAFGGIAAMNTLAKVVSSISNVQFEVKESVKVYGMEFNEFRLPMGKILFKAHPLMSRHPIYQNSMFILDFDAVKYVALKNRDTKAHDDVQAKDEDVRRGYLQTECSLMVDYGGLTCGYLGNIVP